MDVWIKKCRKQARCCYCPEPITNGTYEVVVKVIKWIQKEDSKRRWIHLLRFHPQCWIDQAVDKLEKEHKPETRGRKKLGLADESKAARFKILARRAAVLQRIRKEMEKPRDKQSVDRFIHWGGMLIQLKKEIEPLGGVPKSWE